MDGAQLTLPGLILTNNTPVNAGFGTHGILGDPGLVLLENLNYIRSYNRADPDEQAPTLGTPRVTVTNFDGPRPVTVWEPISDDLGIQTLKAVNYTEDATRADHNHGGVDETQLYLVNGRRITALVVTPTSDQVTYADGIRTVIEDPLPGVKWANQVDAVGCITPLSRQDLLSPVTPWFNADTVTFVGEGIYATASQFTHMGNGQPEGSVASALTAGVFSAAALAGQTDHRVESYTQGSNGPCACRCETSNEPRIQGCIDTTTNAMQDFFGGDGVDLKHGITLCGGNDLPNLSEADGDIQSFPIKGQKEDDPGVLKFRYDWNTGKYYRFVGFKTINGVEVPVWGGPGSIITDDGEAIVGSDYEVPQHLIDTLRKLAPSGIEVPEAIYDAVAFMAKSFLYFEELALVVQMSADGKIDAEETSELVSLIVADATTRVVVGICTFGVAYVLFKFAKKAQLMRRILNWIRKRRAKKAADEFEKDFKDAVQHAEKMSVKAEHNFAQIQEESMRLLKKQALLDKELDKLRTLMDAAKKEGRNADAANLRKQIVLRAREKQSTIQKIEELAKERFKVLFEE